MIHIKRLNEMESPVNEGILSAIKARAQIVKVQGWFFDAAAQAIADNPKKYTSAEQLVNALQSDAEKEYKKVVTVEDALTFRDWWGDFKKSAVNALERNFKQSMNEALNGSAKTFNERTTVILRKEDDGNVIAFFPSQINGNRIACYSHMGQHSEADIDYMLNDTHAVTNSDNNDAMELLDELRQVGYKNIYPITPNEKCTIEYHRKPTASEAKFGYGGVQYRDFPLLDVLDKNGDIKKRIKDEKGNIYTY